MASMVKIDPATLIGDKVTVDDEADNSTWNGTIVKVLRSKFHVRWDGDRQADGEVYIVPKSYVTIHPRRKPTRKAGPRTKDVSSKQIDLTAEDLVHRVVRCPEASKARGLHGNFRWHVDRAMKSGKVKLVPLAWGKPEDKPAHFLAQPSAVVPVK